MLDEPVRGAVPQPALFSLSGLEILRAYMQGHLVATPLQRFLGARVTQVSSGTAVVHQAISPWFEMNDGFVDLTPFAEYVLLITAMTGAPPATQLRTANVSLRFLRPCTLESEMVIARGRIVHAGSSFTTVEALFEDSLGRAIATTSGCVTVTPILPPPPTLERPLVQVAEPSYGSSDPRSRPLARNVSDQLPPFGSLIGAELVDAGSSSGAVAMRASEWFCQLRSEVSVGIISLLGHLAVRRAIGEVLDPDERFVVPTSLSRRSHRPHRTAAGSPRSAWSGTAGRTCSPAERRSSTRTDRRSRLSTVSALSADGRQLPVIA